MGVGWSTEWVNRIDFEQELLGLMLRLELGQHTTGFGKQQATTQIAQILKRPKLSTDFEAG